MWIPLDHTIMCIMGWDVDMDRLGVMDAADRRSEPLIWDPVEQYMEEPPWFETWGQKKKTGEKVDFLTGMKREEHPNYTTCIY